MRTEQWRWCGRRSRFSGNCRNRLQCGASCGYDACVANNGIDLMALSEPDSGGIGSFRLHTMRAASEPDSPHRSPTYALQPDPGVWCARRPNALAACGTRRVTTIQAESCE